MVQKKLPLINSAHGSETRNIINELIKLFNGMGYTYNESLQKARDILDEAQQTNDMNESVQQQINTLIAESGTSDAEVLQARIDAEGNEYPVLKDRLDENDAQLAETKHDVNLVRGSKADQSDLNVERQRIDLLTTLPEGSTQGDAELMDIRVGSDGEIYNNAGDSVRQQVSKTNDEIKELDNTFYNQFPQESLLVNLVKNGRLETGDEHFADGWSKGDAVPLGNYFEYDPIQKSQKVDFKYRDGHLNNHFNITKGHTYFIKFMGRKIRDEESKVLIGFVENSNDVIQNYVTVESSDYSILYNTVFKRLEATIDGRMIAFTGAAGVGANLLMKRVTVFDLTDIYGKGNEPNNNDFNNILGMFPDYFIDKTGIIKTIGKSIDENTVSINENINLIRDIESRVELLEQQSGGVSEVEKKPATQLNFEPLGQALSLTATSYDGNVYGVDASTAKLVKSQDSGMTFTASPLPRPPIGQISHLSVFADGSCVAISRDGKFARADGYDQEFEIVQDTGAQFRVLSISSYSNGLKKYIFAGEYDGTSTMKRLHISKDGGRTYTVLKEGGVLQSDNNHWHTVAYDPYTDGIFCAMGDGSNARIYYTPDYGETWERFDGEQPTSIAVFPNRIVFGRDMPGRPPGADKWERSKVFVSDVETAFEFRDDVPSSVLYYPDNTQWNSPNPNEYYLLFTNRQEAEDYSYIYGTGDGGKTWHKVCEVFGRAHQLSGVDKNGYIYFVLTGSSLLHRAETISWEVQD